MPHDEKIISEIENAWREIQQGNLLTACDKFKELDKIFKDIFSLNIKLLNNRVNIKRRDQIGKKTDVSIIIPVYNNAEYLPECLDSVLGQSMNNIEIIIINDGSTDTKAIRILNDYASRDERILLINKNNTGYGHSVNIGLDLANGKYVGIVESDDFIQSGMYERLYEIAEKLDADVVKCDFARFITHNGDLLFKRVKINANHGYYNKIINPAEHPDLLRMYTLNQNGIYKNELIKSNNIYLNETPGASFQDHGLFFQLLMYAKSVICIEEVLYFLRRDNENSSFFAKDKVFECCDEFKFIESIILNNEYLKKLFFGIYYLKKFKNYIANLNRINPQDYRNFFERCHKEFCKIDKIEFDAGIFTENEWLGMQSMINNKENYFRNKITHPQTLDICQSLKLSDNKVYRMENLFKNNENLF